MPKPQLTQQEINEIITSDKSNIELAKIYGRDKKTIGIYRRKAGYVNNHGGNFKLTPYQIKEILSSKLLKKDIAKAYGISLKHTYSILHKHGIKRVKKIPEPKIIIKKEPKVEVNKDHKVKIKKEPKIIVKGKPEIKPRKKEVLNKSIEKSGRIQDQEYYLKQNAKKISLDYKTIEAEKIKSGEWEYRPFLDRGIKSMKLVKLV